MHLTTSNYFSPEIAREYMSTSQFKAFMKCPASIMAEINCEIEPTKKDVFTEGHMFEALVCGGEELFYMQHPEIISSQGKTKGNVKANFQKIVTAAEAFNRQAFFCDIVKRCDKQVLVTGTIAGVKFRGLLDLYDAKTGEIFDTKCMKDFQDVYCAEEGRRVPWWQSWGYHYQAAIYTELARQTFGRDTEFSLIAATKEEVPDISWLTFDNDYLRNVMDIIEESVPMYQAIKDGLIDAERCEMCSYCKSTKIIEQPEIVQMGGCNDD
jgi:hypothetical protein